MRSLLMSVLCFFVVTACGPKKNMIVNARDQDFYSQWVNSAKEAEGVDKKLASVKMIQTGEEFPMRFVLFDNHTFYYQVNRLGSGMGTWSFFEGGLELAAQRPVFDMTLYLSAATLEGNGLTFRFNDCFGLNTVPATTREPAVDSKPLEKFTTSDKGI